ncbi:MAG TPA: mevalonate kinase [Candidatus Sulfomarinibacteraceae bacterium]|nr:mevalonate kinase [Candidatus Sulfomarinibacteraceae bacterium]
MTQASAPGKVILFGEHAVVYGQPAIAAPVTQVRAVATVEDAPDPGVRLVTPDLGQDYLLANAAEEDALATAVRIVQQAAGLEQLPSLIISVNSDIPIASGLGSGAATSAAVIRALARHLGCDDLARDQIVCDLTYEVEKIYHGTPSGIDNTVVALERLVYFVRQQPRNRIETFSVAEPLHLLVGDTGHRSSTRAVVGDVRRQWQDDPARFEAIFTGCGRIAQEARQAIETGELAAAGRLMQENQRLLQEMTVSSPQLDQLVRAANEAGALGAKLSGAGRGGNMIALVQEKTRDDVRSALLRAGAVNVLSSVVE